jgi:hypothetical protein
MERPEHSTTTIVNRLFLGFRYVCFLLGSTLVILAALETVASGGIYLRWKQWSRRENAPCYKAYPQESKEYYRELEEVFGARVQGSTMRYSPFELWKNQDYSAKLINIKNGLRVTLFNKTAPPDKRVFFMGGSAMWGDGVWDSFTIPSLVSKMLNTESSKRVYEGSNFGERAYNIFQEYVRLSRLLAEGSRPDIVVFLDGANEIGATFESGSPRLHYDYLAIRDRFEHRSLINYLDDSYTLRVLRGVARRPRTTQINHDGKLAEEIGDWYCAIKGQIEALAMRYNFKPVFLWQPMLIPQLKNLSDYERHIFAKTPAGLSSLAAQTYRTMDFRIKNGSLGEVYDVSKIFAANSETVYVDVFHVGPQGNTVLATRIVEILRELDDPKE